MLLIQDGKFYGTGEAYEALMVFMADHGGLVLNGCELLPYEEPVEDAIIVDATDAETEIVEDEQVF